MFPLSFFLVMFNFKLDYLNSDAKKLISFMFTLHLVPSCAISIQLCLNAMRILLLKFHSSLFSHKFIMLTLKICENQAFTTFLQGSVVTV